MLVLTSVVLGASAGAASLADARSASEATRPRPAVEHGDDAVPTLLLVDVSQSMSDDDGTGQTRIAGARSGLNAFLQALPDGSTVGLRRYPNNGDCDAGKLSIPIAGLDRGRMGAEVRSLRPDGNTPTADALTAAAQDLKKVGYTSGTIVLVSDGEANCTGDPCAVARGLSAEGFDITINTIGFQISEQGREQLSCIANATAGHYFDVADSAELADELDALTRPQLSLTLDYPTGEVRVAAAGPDGRTVEVHASVKSSGARAARDVQLSISFNVPEGSPNTAAVAVRRPRLRLGNIAPGEHRDASWSFNPPLDERDWELGFTVTVVADNARDPASKTGRIRLVGSYSLDDAGPILSKAERVVIMGDSFSAGEGAGNYTNETRAKPNNCHRSPDTYAMRLFDPAPTVLACSGDTTADLSVDRTRKKETSQYGRLRKLAASQQPPDLVLLTIGGNDVGFAQFLQNCVNASDCTIAPQTETRCAFITGCVKVPTTLAEQLRERLVGLPPALSGVYRQIDAILNSEPVRERRGGKRARIVVLGYPAITTDAPKRSCGDQLAGLNENEERFGRKIARDINDVIEQTIEQLRRDEKVPVYFASDVEDAFQPDHTLCDDVPFVNPLRVGSGWVLAESFHPNRSGYGAMTAALVRWSNNKAATADPGERAVPDLRVAVPSRASGTITVTNRGARGTSELQAGSTYLLQGGGYTPGSPVLAYLRSSPRVIGRGVARSDGTVAITAVVPLDAHRGTHHVQLAGYDNEQIATTVSAEVTVFRSRPIGILILGVIALVAICVGAMATSSLRNQRRRGDRGAI